MQPRVVTSRTLTVLLTLNALLMAGVLLKLLAGDRGTMLPAANAQVVAPIAGGGGLFLMPGQLTRDTWGCYVMDIDAQNLMVYGYDPGLTRGLKLLSTRNFTADRRLGEYNTAPPPREVQQLVDDARKLSETLGTGDRPSAP